MVFHLHRTPTRSHPADAPTTYDRETSSRSVLSERAPWSPAQIVSLAAGALFLVIGGIALARTGIDFSNLTGDHVSVAGAGQTQLMAYIELAYGALLVIAGAVPGAGRGGMATLGVLALVFGIIVSAQPSSFDALGIGSGYAVFLIVVGVILVGTAIAAPVYWSVTDRSGTRSRRGSR